MLYWLYLLSGILARQSYSATTASAPCTVTQPCFNLASASFIRMSSSVIEPASFWLASASEERRAAVQAVLDAGHIPAGMELFKAGNQSQLATIYKWIDASDVYMLILGGRYGSIETFSCILHSQSL